MNTKNLLIIFLAIGFIILSKVSRAEDVCESGMTSDLTTCACQATEKADKELNKWYQETLKQYEDNAGIIKRLKEAQRAWIKFRDAYIESIYPNNFEDYPPAGTAMPMCLCDVQTSLINQRIQQLKNILEIPEYDVCTPDIYPFKKGKYLNLDKTH